MLISDRKFDIRTWVLVDHQYNLYFFNEGYVRMCSEKYDSSSASISNPLIHLTNNAVQKHG
jgi:tubulin--tyrosine ligase